MRQLLDLRALSPLTVAPGGTIVGIRVIRAGEEAVVGEVAAWQWDEAT